MEMIANWQMYVALGLLLIIIEAFISTFFLFPIGISLLFTAIAAPFLSFEAELILFAFLCIINFVISVKILKPKFQKNKSHTGVDSLIGRIVPVFEEINEEAGTGYVKVYADEWRALPTESGQIFTKNEKVKIDKMDGNKVFVSKA